jgi:hypothetical protein
MGGKAPHTASGRTPVIRPDSMSFFREGGGHGDGVQFLLTEAVVVVKIEDYTSVLYVYMHTGISLELIEYKMIRNIKFYEY